MEEFGFLLKLAKPLALNLPDATDRARAALWLKKLCEVNSHDSETTLDRIHVEFLKLLLFVMQNNRLTGIFEQPPPSGKLQEMLSPGQRKVKDMLPLARERKTSTKGKQASKGHSRVTTSISGDMCEYVAVQDIPNFGIHGYYAMSTQPLSKWWMPQNYASQHTKTPTSIRDRNSKDEIYETAEGTSILEVTKSGEATTKLKKDTHENSGHSKAERVVDESLKQNKEKSTENKQQKIFEAARNAVAGTETRPCWGRSRFIDRLIDESPHLVGDLDLSEADALLHLYRDKKLRKVKKTRKSGGSKGQACAMSAKRREVEARLDLAPCAIHPDKDLGAARQYETSGMKQSRTCVPKHINNLQTLEDADCRTFDRYYISENEEYYPTDPIESVGSISLRDDYNAAYNSQHDIHDAIHVDDLATFSARPRGELAIDALQTGNIAWVTRDTGRFRHGNREDTRDKNYSQHYLDTNSNLRDRYDELLRDGNEVDQFKKQNYEVRNNGWSLQDQVELSSGMSRNTTARSRISNASEPGFNETSYWNKIVDFQDRIEDQSIPEDYDNVSSCDCRNDQYDLKRPETVVYGKWRDSDYDRVDDEFNESMTTMEKQHITGDPGRKEPSSSGTLTGPRRKSSASTDKQYVDTKNWTPQGHSTIIGQ